MDSTQPKPTSRAASAPTIAEKLEAISGALILLVDDNDMNLEIAAELLRETGFLVDLAENGEVAVAKVLAGAYDIVLMDMQMPVMDGATATREIRAEQRFAALPIVAMSGDVSQTARNLCFAAGMNDHVGKPFECEILWKMLTTWIKPRRAVSRLSLVPQQADQAPELVVDVPGLDTISGLRRVVGNKPLYLAMLRRFVDGQQQTAQKITTALSLGDRPTAERLAHSLRGVSGNIGATVVQQRAGRLESAIRERRPRGDLDARAAELATELARLLVAMQQSFPEERSGELTITVDAGRLDTVCAELRARLAHDDAEAVELVLANANFLRAAMPGHYRALERAVHAFEFETALGVLEAAHRPVARVG